TPSFSLLDTNICIGDNIDISIQNPATTDQVTYTWTNPNDATPFIGQVYNGTFNESTEIIVEAVSPSCFYIDTVIVDVQAFPDITLTGDTMLCDGETVFITASDATGNTQQMQWSLTDPGTPPQFNPNQPVTSDPVFTYTPTGDMTIYLIARTSQGCMGSKSINISITDPRVVANKYKVCPEDPVVLTGFDAVDYSWSANPPDATLPTGRSANSVTAHPLETTVYTMRGYGESGCFAERTLKVTVIPYPEGEISYSPSYVDVDNPVLSIKDVSKYGVTSRWDISDGTTSEQRSFSHKFNDVSGQSVEIRLTSYNEVGCADTASVVVPIELFSVWVPNAFSPDGDGRNDRFFFKSLNKLDDVKFEVYNKWGERLFLFENPNFESSADMSEVHGWDGKFNGKDVPGGSYVWRLTYKRQGNERVYDKNGTINIIR
ncbi:MAG TPA: gliding motility-associated C-terminal domain-containing protein, partial [Bacteroidales bacterium]|nr:gliding motility-associated C-terminal domain-containing protein [Bacteroidales bacterium]